MKPLSLNFFQNQYSNTLQPVLPTIFQYYTINYKTRQKHIAFRMDATNEEAVVAIEISHSDTGIQQLYFEQFLEMKTMMAEAIGEGWEWLLHTTNETGQTISRIFISIGNVNVFNKADWPALISFFKKHMIALDGFWSEVKYAFEDLGM